MTEPILHRGDTRDHAENTRPAFASAADLRMGFECDIHPTVSTTVCVIHDNTWDRTTPESGAVSATAQSVIDTYETDDGSAIPSLRQALAYNSQGAAPILLDIKETEKWTDAHLLVLRQRIVENNPQRVFVFLNDQAMIARLTTLVPEARISYRPLGEEEFSLEGVLAMGAKALQPQYDVMTPSRVRAYQDAGLRVILQDRGLDNQEAFNDAMNLGADYVLINARRWFNWK